MTHLHVYRQPAASAPKWAGRGVTLALCYEPSNGTVPFKAWDAAWIAAGCTLVREPSGDWFYDNLLPQLESLLCPIQEADNDAVTQQDTGDPATKSARVEAVYAGVEAWAAMARQNAPNKSLAIVLGLEQLRWGKADYARLIKPFDRVNVDWYPILRGRPVSEMVDLVKRFRDTVAGAKLWSVDVEGSAQGEPPNDYPDQREPTADEFRAELDGVAGLGLAPSIFPQQFRPAFQYDAMTPPLVSALAAWRGPVAAPAPVPDPPPRIPIGPPPTPTIRRVMFSADLKILTVQMSDGASTNYATTADLGKLIKRKPNVGAREIKIGADGKSVAVTLADGTAANYTR